MFARGCGHTNGEWRVTDGRSEHCNCAGQAGEKIRKMSEGGYEGRGCVVDRRSLVLHRVAARPLFFYSSLPRAIAVLQLHIRHMSLAVGVSSPSCDYGASRYFLAFLCYISRAPSQQWRVAFLPAEHPLARFELSPVDDHVPFECGSERIR